MRRSSMITRCSGAVFPRAHVKNRAGSAATAAYLRGGRAGIERASAAHMLCRFPSALAPLVLLVAAACGPAPGDGDRPPTCGLAPLVFDPRAEVVQASDDDGACVRLERRPVGEPDVMYKEYPYEPVRLVAAAADLFLDVSDAGALSYTATHHNWLDEMSGTDDDGARATVVFRYHIDDGAFSLDLTVTNPAGTVVAGPIELTPAGQLDGV